MHCPVCHVADTKVVDSRLGGEGYQVRRRRECLSCQERFTTYETIEVILPRLHKRDGSYVQFEEGKLRSGLVKALDKRRISTAEIDRIISEILYKLRGYGEREITTILLGEWVMQALKKVDRVAYVRFASVYRRFEDVDAFAKEIEKLRYESS